jgi:hypothetical protein
MRMKYPSKNLQFIKLLSILIVILIISFDIRIASSSEEKEETIRILPYIPAFLKLQEYKDCNKDNSSSAYNSCYGRDMIFEVVSESHPKSEEEALEKNIRHTHLTEMKKFAAEISKVGIEINPILVSLKFKFLPSRNKANFILPHIFFSGNENAVKSRTFITLKEAREAGKHLPGYLKSQIESNALYNIVERNFKSYFKEKSDYQGPVFIFSSDINSSDELESIALNFRLFILNHFIDTNSYEEFIKDHPLTTSLKKVEPTMQDVVNYATGCASRPVGGFATYKLVFDLTLREKYLCEKQADHLRKIFDVSLDDLFGPGRHKPHQDEKKDKTLKENEEKKPNSEKGMSYCFHQSEQSFLRYLFGLKRGTLEKDTKNSFNARLIGFIKTYTNENIERHKYTLEVLKYIDKKKPELLDEELPKLGQEQVQPEVNSGPKNKKKQVATPQNIVNITFEEDIDINLEITSARHICKFCRGTLYECQNKILDSLKKVFLEGEITIENDNKFNSIYEAVSKGVDLSLDEIYVIMLKFKGDINLEIFASSFKPVKEEGLMGKMESNNE